MTPLGREEFDQTRQAVAEIVTRGRRILKHQTWAVRNFGKVRDLRKLRPLLPA